MFSSPLLLILRRIFRSELPRPDLLLALTRNLIVPLNAFLRPKRPINRRRKPATKGLPSTL